MPLNKETKPILSASFKIQNSFDLSLYGVTSALLRENYKNLTFFINPIQIVGKNITKTSS